MGPWLVSFSNNIRLSCRGDRVVRLRQILHDDRDPPIRGVVRILHIPQLLIRKPSNLKHLPSP